MIPDMLPKNISDFVFAYSLLEQAVQQRITRICASVCSVCSCFCCKIVFCRESMESPFLQQVMNAVPASGAWDPVKGWIGNLGCRLAAGRPPVCYAFVCGELAAQQVSNEHRYVLNVLSMLMTYVGRNALGKRHLVELCDLQRINTARLARQQVVAGTILSHIDGFYENPRTYPLPFDLFRHVCRPPVSLTNVIRQKRVQ
jgi:hypothetical protein